MSDLIKREDAIKALCDAVDNKGDYEGEWLYTDEFCKAIDSVPSADRPQGEWIVSDDKYFHTCQFCNADVDVSMGTGIFVDNDEVSHMNFCPNCGAKMDGEREGE